MTQPQDYIISAIRMLSTVMVVVLHIFQQLEKVYAHLHYVTDWFNLGLVMFFCISGFLYSERAIDRFGKWIMHRYKELILPSTITVILAIIIYWIAKGPLSIKTVLYSLLSGLGFEAFVPDAWMFVQYWFLTYLLFCYVLLPLAQRIDIKKHTEIRFWSGMIVATVLLQAIASGLKMQLNLPAFSWGVLLRFFLPYFIYRRYDTLESRKKVFRLLTPIAVFSVCLACLLRYHFSFVGAMASVAELVFIYAETLSGTVLFHWLYTFLSKKRLPKSVLEMSDKYSYYVFLTHCLFIGYSTSVIFRFQSYWLGIAVSLVLTGASSVILRMISHCLQGKGKMIQGKHYGSL